MGLAPRARASSGIATTAEIFSGLVRARRFGMSSPKMTEMAVIRATDAPMPTGLA